MKPAVDDKRLGTITLEQFLGLSAGMSLKVAGRMISLAGDYTNDLIALHADGMDPRHTRDSLARLARRATRTESELAQLLVLAAQHCADDELADVPQAIRANMKTASRCRSAICATAMAAHGHAREERLAA
jgi:hypothetical protein